MQCKNDKLTIKNFIEISVALAAAGLIVLCLASVLFYSLWPNILLINFYIFATECDGFTLITPIRPH